VSDRFALADPSALERAFWAVLAPPPPLDVSEWADAHIRLSSKTSAEPGPYRSARTPYAIEPMQRLSEGDRCERVVLMWGSQLGKSSVGNNWLGYIMAHAPGPSMMMQPTVEMAETYSKQRIAPMISDAPTLRRLVADPKSRDSGNTLTLKEFPGGMLKIVGANAPSPLASMPIRYVFADEIDRFPASAGSEGDPLELAAKRTTSFPNRKLLITSTPTVKGASRVESEYLRTGQRVYEVPCPHCGTYQHLQWEHLHWNDRDPASVYYECAGCDDPIYDRHKATMLPRGRWVATVPEAEDGRVYGYHLSSLYAPAGWTPASWPSLVAEFLQCDGDPKLLQVFVNTRLAETWDEFRDDDIDETGLAERAEEYAAEVPAGVAVLTAGVDVQIDRVEVEVVGWGPGEESWSIDYAVIPGDPSGPMLWDDLRVYLERVWQHETAGPMTLAAACIDAGYMSDHVQAFAHAHRRRRWYAIKGVAGPKRPLWPKRGRKGNRKGAARVYNVGVDTGKDMLWARLQRVEAGAGALHFPAGRDLGWYQQLLAERPVVRYSKGRPIREWRAVGSARSEALDCRVYASAALHSLLAVGRSLESLHAALPELSPGERARRTREAAEPAPPTPRKPQQQKRPRSRGKFRPRF